MGLLLFTRGALTAIPIAITFLDRVGYPALVDGVSMQPTLNPDATQTDIVFLNRWSVRGYNLNHGDIVSLVSPKNPNDRLIKRIIALEGDELDTIGYKSSFLRIPDGHCWVEGDNTGRSCDSNLFGPVSLGLITARATCILWPPSRWQFLETFLPVNRVPYKISRKNRAIINKQNTRE